MAKQTDVDRNMVWGFILNKLRVCTWLQLPTEQLRAQSCEYTVPGTNEKSWVPLGRRMPVGWYDAIEFLPGPQRNIEFPACSFPQREMLFGSPIPQASYLDVIEHWERQPVPLSFRAPVISEQQWIYEFGAEPITYDSWDIDELRRQLKEHPEYRRNFYAPGRSTMSKN